MQGHAEAIFQADDTKVDLAAWKQMPKDLPDADPIPGDELHS